MKSLLAAFLAVLMLAASLDAGAHAGTGSRDGAAAPASAETATDIDGMTCCEATGHHMSTGCSFTAHLEAECQWNVPAPLVGRLAGPPADAPAAAMEPDAPRKPPGRA